MKFIYGIVGGLVILVVFSFIKIVELDDKISYLQESFDHKSVVCIELEQPEFLMSNPEDGLMKALEYYKVKHKNIVYAQAILETGHFRSKVFREYNNLFGLYNSRTKDYYKFDHWNESVIAYLKYIQYRYKPPDDYYSFLKRIGYAEDPLYIQKLKVIEGKYGQKSSSE